MKWLAFLQLRLSGRLAVAALVVASVAVSISLRAKQQGNATQPSQRGGNATASQPHLTVLGTPSVECYPYNPSPATVGVPDTLSDSFNLLIRGAVRLKNDGSRPASIVARAWSDSVSTTPTIRDSLLDPSLVDGLRFQRSPDFHATLHIEPGDTATVHLEQTIRSASASSFVLDLVFLYLDDAEQLYDTYYRARYELCRPAARVTPVPGPAGVVVGYKISRSASLWLQEFNESSVLYEPQEATLILGAIRRAS